MASSKGTSYFPNRLVKMDMINTQSGILCTDAIDSNNPGSLWHYRVTRQ